MSYIDTASIDSHSSVSIKPPLLRQPPLNLSTAKAGQATTQAATTTTTVQTPPASGGEVTQPTEEEIAKQRVIEKTQEFNELMNTIQTELTKYDNTEDLQNILIGINDKSKILEKDASQALSKVTHTESAINNNKQNKERDDNLLGNSDNTMNRIMTSMMRSIMSSMTTQASTPTSIPMSTSTRTPTSIPMSTSTMNSVLPEDTTAENITGHIIQNILKCVFELPRDQYGGAKVVAETYDELAMLIQLYKHIRQVITFMQRDLTKNMAHPLIAPAAPAPAPGAAGTTATPPARDYKKMMRFYINRMYALFQMVTYLIRSHPTLPTWVNTINQMFGNDDFDGPKKLRFDTLFASNEPPGEKTQSLKAKLRAYNPPNSNPEDKAYHFFTYWMVDEDENDIERTLQIMANNQDLNYQATSNEMVLTERTLPTTAETVALQNMQGQAEEPAVNGKVVVYVGNHLWFESNVLSVPGNGTTKYRVQRVNSHAKYATFATEYDRSEIRVMPDTPGDIHLNNVVAVKLVLTDDWAKNILVEAHVLSISESKCTVAYLNPLLSFQSLGGIFKLNASGVIAELKTKATANIDATDPICTRISQLLAELLDMKQTVDDAIGRLGAANKDLFLYKSVLEKCATVIDAMLKVTATSDIVFSSAIIGTTGITHNPPPSASSSATPATIPTQILISSIPIVLNAFETIQKQWGEMDKILPSIVDKKDVVFIEAK
jgi:hypothetical protein